MAIVSFDVGGGIQDVTNSVWISDFVGTADVRFHVGLTGLSLFMVALSAVGVAAAMWTAIPADRERLRVYVSLLLLLEAALMTLFTARDLVLFYVGWEVMMIALFVLMGVWGGAGRRYATLQFIIYSLLGSLLMLVAIAALGVEGHSFDLAVLSAQGRDSAPMFLAFAAAFCIKAPMFPLHGWLPAAYRQSTPEVTALLSGVVSKAGAYGLITFAVPLFAKTAYDWRWLFLGLGLAGLLYASLVAFRQPDARGVVAYSSIGQMNLIVIGIFALSGLQRQRPHRRHLPDGQPRRRLAGGVPVDRDPRAALRHRPAGAAGRARQPPARGVDGVPDRRPVRAGRARVVRVRVGAVHPDRRLPGGPAAGRGSGARHRAGGHVHASLVLGHRPR